MNNIFLKKAIFKNRVPFESLNVEFYENDISVLTGINGKGKTSFMSHVVDAFNEMSRQYFPNSFENRENKLYRISSSLYSMNKSEASIVYLRFESNGENIDYVDIRGKCTQEYYEEIINLDKKIEFSFFKDNLENDGYIKTISNNYSKEIANQVFNNNLITYFPSYRYELPGYLNDPYKVDIQYNNNSKFSGSLINPIEVVSNLSDITNWIMDLILDNQYLNVDKESLQQNLHLINGDYIQKDQLPDIIHRFIRYCIDAKSELRKNLNKILTSTFSSKVQGNLRFGIGKRGYGSTRLQIVSEDNGVALSESLSNISSGEASILCIFLEMLRQADNIKNDIILSEIKGIVLIDEVDKHLHIKLQKEVLPSLFNLFPNVQFIVSSHSPFLNMGLAETVPERSRIVDLDNMGISKDPTKNDLYLEVYQMMIEENNRFKNMYDNIQAQVIDKNKLQIITEGKNTEHIEKAISILAPQLLDSINIVTGCEDKSGEQQLKNAFEIMKNGNHTSKFLFVWDCDSNKIVEKVIENEIFKKFCFSKNEENDKVKKGIENLYPLGTFSDKFYDLKESSDEYGGTTQSKCFNKANFLEYIISQTDESIFKNYEELINKIQGILS